MSHFVTQSVSHEDQHIDYFRNPGPGGFPRVTLVCDSSVWLCRPHRISLLAARKTSGCFCCYYYMESGCTHVQEAVLIKICTFCRFYNFSLASYLYIDTRIYMYFLASYCYMELEVMLFYCFLEDLPVLKIALSSLRWRKLKNRAKYHCARINQKERISQNVMREKIERGHALRRGGILCSVASKLT